MAQWKKDNAVPNFARDDLVDHNDIKVDGVHQGNNI
jgi:hypothetical protein